MTLHWDRRRDVAVLLALVARVGTTPAAHDDQVISALVSAAKFSTTVRFPNDEDRMFKAGAALVPVNEPNKLVDCSIFSAMGQDAQQLCASILHTCRALVEQEGPPKAVVGRRWDQLLHKLRITDKASVKKVLVDLAKQRVQELIAQHRQQLETMNPALWAVKGLAPNRKFPQSLRSELVALADELDRVRATSTDLSTSGSNVLRSLAGMAQNRPSGPAALMNMRKAGDGRKGVPIAALVMGIVVLYRGGLSLEDIENLRALSSKLFKGPFSGLEGAGMFAFGASLPADWGLAVDAVLYVQTAHRKEFVARHAMRETALMLHVLDVDWLVGCLFAVQMCKEIYSKNGTAWQEKGVRPEDPLSVLNLYKRVAGMEEAVVGPFMSERTEAAWLWRTR